MSYRVCAAQLATLAPDGTDRRWLGVYGAVAAPVWSSAYPGGDLALTATLQCDPTQQLKALQVGRKLRVCRGGSDVWRGFIDDATPIVGGFAISGHGIGSEGNRYRAEYASWVPNDPVNRAITRGLAWVNPGAGITAAVDMSQQLDTASADISTYLNGITSTAGLGWQVKPSGWDDVLTVGAIPTVPTRLLIATAPVARTLYGYFTDMALRYQSSGTSSAPVYSLAWAANLAQRAQFGRSETYGDLSPEGTITGATAIAAGTALLSRYQAAGYSAAIPIQPGQLLTMGGVPVDLATERAGGTVVQLVLAGGGTGGEVAPAVPVTFALGMYEYHGDDGTAVATPLVYAANDLGGILGTWVAAHTPKPKA